ncbi:hypothetical protein K461DRAFT_274108 [Myriangium duriaei CBS 260.36]|uniref:Uncharacterized protein n=1 Tax=Myriangium duriaei CBS 260.36 TaxID=1168546 RepID=A0A9P4MLZ3_9PEZI|nr:hypothetical protein K461DRAFT_274108 [Myriangium duriaei CBS 260.36]
MAALCPAVLGIGLAGRLLVVADGIAIVSVGVILVTVSSPVPVGLGIVTVWVKKKVDMTVVVIVRRVEADEMGAGAEAAEDIV